MKRNLTVSLAVTLLAALYVGLAPRAGAQDEGGSLSSAEVDAGAPQYTVVKLGSGTPELSIVNSKHREVPEDRVKVLLITACRVVSEEFRRDASETAFKLTLVLGGKEEHYTISPYGDLTLYLNQWNEDKFVEGAITGAVLRLTAPHTRKRMRSDVLRRASAMAPINVKALQGGAGSKPVLVPRPPDCFSAVSDTSCPWPSQPLSANEKHRPN